MLIVVKHFTIPFYLSTHTPFQRNVISCAVIVNDFEVTYRN
jgi:hypothetical protein